MIGSMREFTENAGLDVAVPVGIPAIDAAMPTAFETATFALG